MHKPHSGRDIKRDLDRERLDEATERYDREREAVINAVIGFDQNEKALTGRRVEQYEEESGVRESELFPEGGRVLNIGDPWQVMDREGVVNLEYETGEEADFLLNPDMFFETFSDEINRCLDNVSNLESYEPELARELSWRLKGVREFAVGMNADDYPKQARVLYDALRLLGESHRPDEEDETKRELWYALMCLARGLQDIHYTQTVIEPALEEAERTRSDTTEEKRAKLVSSLIADFRGGNKYKQAELVKGAFPLTDFEDQSFDRIVASWSLSVHMFAAMDARHFETVFAEIGRLLKPDGAAYLWPLRYHFYDKNNLARGLAAYGKRGGTAGLMTGWGSHRDVVWMDEEPERFLEMLDTSDELMILSPGTKSRKETKNRIDESLDRDDGWGGAWGTVEAAA